MLIEALFNQTTAFAWVRSVLVLESMYSRHRQIRTSIPAILGLFGLLQPLGFFLASILVVPSLSCMVLRE